ncbi:hypothetical protein Hanom_Chr00s022935g01762161 [Helianthus anomalus]
MFGTGMFLVPVAFGSGTFNGQDLPLPLMRNNLPHGECIYLMIWFWIKRNLLIHLRRQWRDGLSSFEFLLHHSTYVENYLDYLRDEGFYVVNEY